MKGAVLHKLGLNAIKERVMRRHYGVEYKAPFEEGVHPEHLKTRNAAGTIVCRAACKWYANKVLTSQSFSTDGDRVRKWGRDILSNTGSAHNSILSTTSPIDQLHKQLVLLFARMRRHLPIATIPVCYFNHGQTYEYSYDLVFCDRGSIATKTVQNDNNFAELVLLLCQLRTWGDIRIGACFQSHTRRESAEKCGCQVCMIRNVVLHLEE